MDRRRAALARSDVTGGPEEAYDLIFSSAGLPWLPDHGHLFPGLVSTLAPGGVPAVQMPLSRNEPPTG